MHIQTAVGAVYYLKSYTTSRSTGERGCVLIDLDGKFDVTVFRGVTGED